MQPQQQSQRATNQGNQLEPAIQTQTQASHNSQPPASRNTYGNQYSRNPLQAIEESFMGMFAESKVVSDNMLKTIDKLVKLAQEGRANQVQPPVAT